MLFEHSGEMLRVFKTQLFCSGGDARSADEQLLSLAHDKSANDVSRCVLCHLADQVTKVVGGDEKFLGTIFYCGEPVSQLQTFVVITLQKILKACEQVAGRLCLQRELTGIVSCYMF